jgi:hypothetical protein
VAKIPKRLPRDVNQRAHAIARMITEEEDANTDPRPIESIEKMRSRAAKGGRARSSSLSDAERTAIARKAARTRWRKAH